MRHLSSPARSVVCAFVALATALFGTPVANASTASADASADAFAVQAHEQHAETAQALADAIGAGASPARAKALLARQRASSSAVLAKTPRALRKAEKSLPSEYYLSGLDEATEAKDQSPWGTCWAFGGIAALESAVLKQQHAQDSAYKDSDASQLQVNALASAYESDSVPDYSEHHLALFAMVSQTEQTAGAQAGEGLSYRSAGASSKAGAKTLLDNGGTDYPTEALFTARQGIVAESDEPYTYRTSSGTFEYAAAYNSQFGTAAKSKDWSLDDEHRLDSSGVTVQDFSYLPAPALLDGDGQYAGYDASATIAIKQAIMQTGAVACGIDADTSTPNEVNDFEYLSGANWCQYNDETDFGDSSAHGVDHEVCIIGWNDAYPASNFGGSIGGSPADDAATYGYPNAGNGAWLVKNSWGSADYHEHLGYSGANANWGITYTDAAGDERHSGLFWVSYYDHSLYEGATSIAVASTAENYDMIHQHDFLANATSYGGDSFNLYGGSLKCANIFTAGTDTANTAYSEPYGEILKAVSAHTDFDNSHVEIDVYLLADGQELPDLAGGGFSAATHASADEPYAGFHVIALDRHVPLDFGQRYAVVETITYQTFGTDASTTTMHTLPLEFGYTASSEYSFGETATAIANDGETFASFDGGATWQTPAELTEWFCDAGCSYGNAMIKAYADTYTAPARGPINLQDVKATTGIDAATPLVYDGTSKAPTDITLTYGPTTLQKDADYTIAYAGSTVDAGSFTITATAVEGSAYTGEVSRTFTIDPADISGAEASVQDQLYTGAALKPEPAVTLDGRPLVAEQDYKVVYANNVQPGTATIDIVGVGNYTGRCTTTFTITAPPQAETAASSGVLPAGAVFTASAAGYKVASSASGAATGTVVFTKAPNKKSVTVPCSVTRQGVTYKVVGIAASAFKEKKIRSVVIGSNVVFIKNGAFKKSKALKVTVKSKLLKKAKVKGCFKSSKVKTVKVKVGSKKLNRKFVKKYKKIFTKKNTKTKAKKLTVK